jgi:hypothetical protein
VHAATLRSDALRIAKPNNVDLLATQLALLGVKVEREYRFHPIRRWRFDFAAPAVRVGVEYNGGIFAHAETVANVVGGELVADSRLKAGRHTRGAGQLGDMEKSNAAIELGWVVLVYGPPHVRSGEAALQIQRVITARSFVGLEVSL